MIKPISRITISLLLMFLLITSTALAAGSVQDYAGIGEPGQADGTLGEGQLNQPGGLMIDAKGDLWIVDSANQKIRKTTADGKLITVAGANRELDEYGLPFGGYVDGDAVKAVFNQPRAIVQDSKGNVYVSDFENHVIRKISGGQVVTFAGSGDAGYKDGSGGIAMLNGPSGLAIDVQDNLYVADTLNHVIRKITPSGTVSTYAGITNEDGGYLDGDANKAQFNEPYGLAFDEEGHLYVSDTGNHLIRLIADGKVSTYAGTVTSIDEEFGYRIGGYLNGDKDKARFNYPKGIVYAAGVLFVADSLNNRIRAVDTNGQVINLAGKSTAGDAVGATEEAQFNNPVAVAYRNGKLYVADQYNHKIKTLELDLKNLKAIRTEEDIVASIELLEATDVPQVWFDGERISFAHADPYNEGNQTFLPIRELFEKQGAKVVWYQDSRVIEISKGDHWTIKLQQDSVGIVTQDNRSYIDLNYLRQVSKFMIFYVEDYNAVVIISK